MDPLISQRASWETVYIQTTAQTSGSLYVFVHTSSSHRMPESNMLEEHGVFSIFKEYASAGKKTKTFFSDNLVCG